MGFAASLLLKKQSHKVMRDRTAQVQDFRMQTELINLQDDGKVPNNATLPLILYRDALEPGATADDAITLFSANGWGGAWINGIFDYHHYHARSHEVLANVGRTVTVQFGGEAGPVIDFHNRAVVVIPAGGGHCRLSSGSGLEIVGAYPSGQESWDLKRADNPADYTTALKEIPNVPLPNFDPIQGAAGPLLKAWYHSR